jgi:hypothetical protein
LKTFPIPAGSACEYPPEYRDYRAWIAAMAMRRVETQVAPAHSIPAHILFVHTHFVHTHEVGHNHVPPPRYFGLEIDYE